ncbi:MAG: universal stress protein [Desulforhopalus sp.]
MMPDIKKILYATDLSESAAHAFRYAMFLAEKFDAQVTVLHVMGELSQEEKVVFAAYFDKDVQMDIAANKESDAISRMKERLTAFCEKEFSGQLEAYSNMITFKVCKGYPEEQILKKSDEYQVDIIVMGAHEKGFTHTFLGSVAKRVLRRSRKPVFIIPLPKP